MNLVGLRLSKLSFWGLIALAAVLSLPLILDRTEGPSVPGSVPTAQKPSGLASSPGGPPPFSRFEPLISSRVFSGPPIEEGSTKAVKTAELPSLKGYKLIGVMSGPAQLAGAVVEEVPSRRQEMVGLGDSLGPGKVVAILTDRVVIDEGGRQRQLTLEDRTAKEMNGVLIIRSEAEPRPEKPRTAAAQPSLEASLSTGPLELETAEGATGGVRVISPGRLGWGVGLRPGDVIQARNPTEVQLRLDELAEGRAVDVELNRAGRRLKVRFDPL